MKVFLCGIAGTGMSALAGLFKAARADVYGSDKNFYPPVDKILQDMDRKLFHSFNKDNIPKDIDLCIIGNVISRGNPELEHILDKNIEFLSMAEALYRFFIKGKGSVVVAGTHGKTTITSLIAHLFFEHGIDPGYFIGGKPLNFPSSYNIGGQSYFITEGDEYETSFFDRSSKFLKYHPKYLVLSSLEYDHLDFFPSEELYQKSFKNLVNQVPGNGLIISSADFPMNQEAVKKSFTPVVTFGKLKGEFRISNIRPNGPGFSFTLANRFKRFNLASEIPGKYNIWNICAAFILGLKLGLDPNILSRSIKTFKGVERRLQMINTLGNTIIYEDFAHHPTSIHNILSGLKQSYPQKEIIAVFEPRSWSLRQNYFQSSLLNSFLAADQLIFKDVYQPQKIPPAQRLDMDLLKKDLEASGKTVNIYSDYSRIEQVLSNFNFSRNAVIIIISNGSFGGLPAFAGKLTS